ncbi:MAG: PIN domain-containing protein [Treponema sp.]|jgi:predicted nucleic acid-binding protein|nr:PIN domain-containing protein [Treponema sp.]
MLNSVLVDAGPLIALFDRSDKYHDSIKNFIRDKPYRFVSTLAVITEVSYMLNFNVKVQLEFFEWILGRGLILQEISNGADIAGIMALCRKYADLPMDFADATLVVAAEKTGIRRIISIDSDFDVYRLPGKERIENIFRQNPTQKGR